MRNHSTVQKWRTNIAFALASATRPRTFRSDAALEAIIGAFEKKVPNIGLYRYPSFSGSYSALFARIFHDRIGTPCLLLPFSSYVPFRAEDFFLGSLERLYLLDFVGPEGFANKISQRTSCEVIAFDHKSALRGLPSEQVLPKNLKFHVNGNKSSSVAAYEYFSAKLAEIQQSDVSLLEPKDRDRVEMMLKYIEDIDIRQYKLPDTKAIKIGLEKWRTKLNCLINPFMYEQLLDISADVLIANVRPYLIACDKAAEKLLDKAFKIRLGDGIYGECLAVRADISPDLVKEIARKLIVKSAAEGLRPIAAVIYKRKKRLKMCLRSSDPIENTAEIARVYGGGGNAYASSCIIRLDQYRQLRRSAVDQ